MAGFKSGALNVAKYQSYDENANALGSAVTLSDFRHQWQEADDGHNVTSGSHGGLEAWIATVLKGTGRCSFHIREEDYPWTLGIKAQKKGVLQLQFGKQKPFTIPVYISSVEYENETAAGTDYTLSVKLDGELVQLTNGAVQYSYPS